MTLLGQNAAPPLTLLQNGYKNIVDFLNLYMDWHLTPSLNIFTSTLRLEEPYAS